MTLLDGIYLVAGHLVASDGGRRRPLAECGIAKQCPYFEVEKKIRR